MYVHVTKDGTKIELSNLGNAHLDNIIKLIEKKAEEGVTVRYGGVDIGGGEPWYDEDTLYGDDAKSLMHYWDYIREKAIRQSKEQEE